MMPAFFKKILSGNPNKKVLERLHFKVREINALEQEFQKKTDDELREATNKFTQEIAKRETESEQDEFLDAIIPKTFAAAREAAKRSLNQRPYDSQIIGALTLHQGSIAEMKTGEGKTLAATMPAYLNALGGRGVHIITVNDYLARRDASWMGQIYAMLGLKVACLQQLGNALIYDEGTSASAEATSETSVQSFKVDADHLRPCARKEAYEADITYGMNSEFGFDYLRDNMVYDLHQKVQRGLHYAIIDEVDSVLIDEARTPLIISAPNDKAQDLYKKFASLVPLLKENTDFNKDEERMAVSLTEEGIKKMERLLNVSNIYTEDVTLAHQLDQALKANVLYRKDKDYVMKDGEIVIVDQFTGRLMQGRRYSQGLHQAIEAKENVEIKQESRTYATITIQNYFRLYKKLSGMTGTAATEAEEFHKIYSLDVVQIPTNKPMIRADKQDVIYKTEQEKFKAIVDKIKKKREIGQPVLVGTISIERNEFLSGLLTKTGIAHEVLNAKNHEREAEIIAQAGRKGAVTVATNMAGRGVDIILGGNPENKEEAEEVKRLGGLCVFGSERHEARRIDNQLRGRSGRQGDQGESQFFISLEDDLMRIFGSGRVKTLMDRLGLPDDTPIENRMISGAIEKAQERVEGHNFDTRKHLVEYDDVINKQRETIYKQRDEILAQSHNGEPLEQFIFQKIKRELSRIQEFHPGEAGIKEIKETLASIPLDISDDKLQGSLDEMHQVAIDQYHILSKSLPTESKESIEKALLLRTIDTLWIDHLDAIEYLRAGIGLRGYGQSDPLVEYKREAYALYQMLLREIDTQVVYNIYKIFIAYKDQKEAAAVPLEASLRQNKIEEQHSEAASFGGGSADSSKGDSPYKGARHEDQKGDTYISKARNPETGGKIGRNDPCWCGSGKKFKRCHGA